jgi:hypothetical protein
LTNLLPRAYGVNVNCSPLQFPRQWPDMRRRSFLLGFPLIGPQAGAYQDICAQLQQRTPDCWSLWGAADARVKAAQFVAKTLGEAVEWPNPIFVPEDPFELLFWDHKSCAIDDLSLVGAFVEIESHFNAQPSEKEMDALAAGTVGGYVDFLLRQATADAR